MPLLIFAAIAGGLALLLWWGLRWRREAIPPSCRRCGYDVSQRPAEAERCSECGGDLAAPRAIVTVRRRWNGWVTIPAAMLLLAVLGVLTINVIGFPWGEWLHLNAPISWIARLATNDPGAAGDAYRETWLRRGGSTSAAFIDHLLDLQGNLNVPWRGRWGDVLTEMYEKGQLDEAQQRRFIRQAFTGPVTWQVRSAVRQEDPLVVSAQWPDRGGAMLNVRTLLAAKVGAPAAVDPERNWSIGVARNGTSRELRARNWGGDILPPGKHTVHLVVAREVVGEGSGGHWPALSERIEHRGAVEVDVLPKAAAIGSAFIDDTKADEVARAVNVVVSHWHDERAFAEVRLFPAGVDRAFSIYAVIDGQEKRIGQVAAAAGQESTSDAIYVPLSVERAKLTDRLTIVLVGDADALKGTLGQTRYWAGRIVYPDVARGSFSSHYDDRVRLRPTTWPYRIDQGATTIPAAARDRSVVGSSDK